MPRRYVTGKTSFGVKNRNALTGTPRRTAIAEHHVEGVVDSQVEAGQDEHGDHGGHEPLGEPAGAAGHDQQ